MKRGHDPPSRPKKLKVRIHEGTSSTTSIERLRYSKTKAGCFNQLSQEVTVLAHPEDGSDQSSSAQESDWTDEEEPVLEFKHQEPEPKQRKKGGGTRYQNTLWNGQHFEKHSFCALGLTLQLGHDGTICPYPTDGVDDFLLIDVTGIHRVSIEYCGCQCTSLPNFKRLGTAFTFGLLNLFHQLTLQGKTNLYDFWLTLLRVTDNSSLASHSRAGRSHDPSLSSGTAQGELAIECSACPHPNGNLPEEWEDADLSIATLHVLILPLGTPKATPFQDIRYCTMDFLVLSTLIGTALLHLVFSYDIACEWSHNFWKHIKAFPVHMQLDHRKVQIHNVIPKFHINAHGLPCQVSYNIAYIPHVGQLCGEVIESNWSHTNALGTSLREMAPGVRHKTLNWQKVLTFGVSFRKKYLEAVRLSKKHEDLFVRFSATFLDATLCKWEKMVLQWEKDKQNPNPYAEDMSATVMTGYRQQFQLHIANLKAPLTAKEKADLQDKRSLLRCCVGMWRSIQALHMPCVAAQFLDGLTRLADDSNNIPEDDEDNEDDNATHACGETMHLHLPSGLPRSLCMTLPYQLDAKELHLRLAQAHDSLSEIWQQRRVLQGLTEFKKQNISGTGQRANMHLRALYNRFNQKTRHAAERYRAACCALMVLDPAGVWSRTLLPLEDQDITGPGRGEEDVSEDQYEMSWIWHVGSNRGGVGEEGSDAGYHEGLRVEWVKSRAQVQHWREEVQLLEEEMRRAVAYLEWKANWWHSQAYRRVDTGVPQDVQHGLAAYAFKQAGVMDGLAVQFASHWLPVLKANKVFPKWGEGYISRGQATCDTPGAVATSDCESSTVDGKEPHHDESETEDLNDDYIDLDD
ncbi:hypothetical protein OE88DRAFT_1642921 [Heliocybe sulcata]|uniref:CxC2-like cysteine cluster KDZ transposase-associated domain-containing protein n=1 Tax=Heliocybe sulcata TaxID=5364 RepID=A0A5C3N980_9AGAM|nr:hypothetical protein OE88DRAFT_1642921 [Heliocybe sulcata]